MGKFLICKVPTGLTFHLKAANGETIGTSEVYNSKEACLGGIESVKTNAPLAPIEDRTAVNFKEEKCPKFQVYAEHGDEKPRFRLLAKNGQEILASQSYTSMESCIKGVHSVKANAPEAVVEEEPIKE